MAEVAALGVRFRIDRAGPEESDSPAVLLLHGIPQTARVWRHLSATLGAERRVLAPDLKGLGGSEVRPPYDVGTLVSELAALVLHEADGPVDVVGHDWGGTLAIGLAAARPDLVRRLVVISAPYRSVNPLHTWHLPLFALPVLPEVAFALGGRSLVRSMIGHGWRAQAQLAAAAVDHYAASYADPARVRAMLGYYRAAVRGRLHDRSSSLGTPGPERSLVVWGAADPVLPPAAGEVLARELGAATTYVSLPGVGHFAPEEAPAEVALLVTDFLTG